MAATERPLDLVTKFPELEAELRDALDALASDWMAGIFGGLFAVAVRERLNNRLANLSELQLGRLRNMLLGILAILDPPLDPPHKE